MRRSFKRDLAIHGGYTCCLIGGPHISNCQPVFLAAAVGAEKRTPYCKTERLRGKKEREDQYLFQKIGVGGRGAVCARVCVRVCMCECVYVFVKEKLAPPALGTPPMCA